MNFYNLLDRGDQTIEEIIDIFDKNKDTINNEIYTSNKDDIYIYSILRNDTNTYNLTLELINNGIYFTPIMLKAFLENIFKPIKDNEKSSSNLSLNLKEKTRLSLLFNNKIKLIEETMEKLFNVISQFGHPLKFNNFVIEDLFKYFYLIKGGDSYINKYLLSCILKYIHTFITDNMYKYGEFNNFVEFRDNNNSILKCKSYNLRLVIGNKNIVDAYLMDNIHIFNMIYLHRTYGMSEYTINYIHNYNIKYEINNDMSINFYEKCEERTNLINGHIDLFNNIDEFYNTIVFVKCPEKLNTIKCKRGFEKKYINRFDDSCCAKELHSDLHKIASDSYYKITTIDDISQKYPSIHDVYDIDTIKHVLLIYSHKGDKIINSFIHNNNEFTPIMYDYMFIYKDMFSFYLEKYDSHLYNYVDNVSRYYNYEIVVSKLIDILNTSFIKCNDYMVVYRGLRTNPNLFIGTIVQFTRFISTSIDINVAERFKGDDGYLIEIIVPEESLILPILNDHTRYIGEHEILLHSSLSYYIYEYNDLHKIYTLVVLDGVLSDKI
jgi:hypothetical protein